MKRLIDALTDGVFDLCVIGSGITGAGVALDAASRGWRVALIDRGDFASGTSSASSKLVHGGLRYLEYGHLHLVHEALHERGLLLRNAPHLVRPLPFVLPFYRGQRVPGWKWRLGLTLYDLLAGRANIARSQPMSRRRLLDTYRGLADADLTGGASYYDALMDDVRLCLAVLQTASRHGAVLANYTEAIGFEMPDGTIAGVRVRDHVGGRELVIRSRAVLNAAGPGADAVCRLAGNDRPHLQPTKGVHIIVRSLGFQHAFTLLHPRDGRVFFVIPWLGKTLIGTTDTFPDADALHVLPAEIAYLLEGYNRYFAPPLASADVMGSFAGLRPLMRSRPGEPSSLSREFRLDVAPTGLWIALGGKYTTFRSMAETIVDTIGRRLGKPRRCRTQSLPLEGTPAEPWDIFAAKTLPRIEREHPQTAHSASHLLYRYGNRVDDVLRAIVATPNGFARLHPEEFDLVGEASWQREEEMAIYPEDFLLRRTRIGMWRESR
ncbi:MAG TPA: glycerol-3-phosphate dehydrogenase/oxidase [Gemmataceae bacterium]|nr:glycerol-3-phosphate dehydrogenase/oxidase [Gemmataceae bacterium]